MSLGNSSKLIPWFWPILADFQNQVLGSNLNITASYEPTENFMDEKVQGKNVDPGFVCAYA